MYIDHLDTYRFIYKRICECIYICELLFIYIYMYLLELFQICIYMYTYVDTYIDIGTNKHKDGVFVCVYIYISSLRQLNGWCS